MNLYDDLFRICNRPKIGKTRQLAESLCIPGRPTLVVAARRPDLEWVRDLVRDYLVQNSGLHYDYHPHTDHLRIHFHHPKSERWLFFVTLMGVQRGEAEGIKEAVPVLTDDALRELLTQAARDRRELDVLKAEKEV